MGESITLKTLFSFGSMKTIPFFARRFVAGVNLEEALDSVRNLNKSRIYTTLDVLGENVKSESQARELEKNYEDVLSKIHDENLNSHISIKLTMFGLDISNSLAEELVRKLLLYSKSKGNIFVRIDMEGSKYTSKTLNIFSSLRREFENVGIVLQAMLHRTKEDVQMVLSIGGRVRLCKGAYKEPKQIALQNMKEIRENYLALSEILLTDNNYHAFATHDDYLLKRIKEMSQSIEKKHEFQMLYGLRRKSWYKLVEEGYKVRIYVPFGTHWFPYFSRRLRERKENILFVIKNLLKD